MTAYLPVLAAIIGIVIYIVASQPKASEAGRLAFFAGLLVSLFEFAGRSISLR